MDQGTILGTIAVVISVASAIIGAINHTKIKSKCCGKEGTISFDIDKTTPDLKIIVPVENK